MFTVAQLIEHLSKLDQSAIVILEGCDCVDYWGGVIDKNERWGENGVLLRRADSVKGDSPKAQRQLFGV